MFRCRQCRCRCTSGWMSKHYLFPKITTIIGRLPTGGDNLYRFSQSIAHAPFILFYARMYGCDVYTTERRQLPPVLLMRALQVMAGGGRFEIATSDTDYGETLLQAIIFCLAHFQNIFTFLFFLQYLVL